MNVHPGFWQDIIAHPYDDAPRLIYADWLEDQGELEQAEYIRVQCQLAASSVADPEYFELLQRNRELALGIRPMELPEHHYLDYHPGIGNFSVAVTQRGFPAHATISHHDMDNNELISDSLERMISETPIRSLTVFGTEPGASEFLLNHPSIAQLHSLELQHWDDEVAEEIYVALANSKYLQRLTSLSLGLEPGDRGIKLLSEMENVPNLRAFHLHVDELNRSQFQSLTQTSWFQRLHHLKLESESFRNRHLEALIQSGPYPEMHILDLSDCDFDAKAVERLTKSKAFPNLKSLRMQRVEFGPKGAEAIAQCEHWSLAELNLWYCQIRGTGLKAIANSENCASLRSLILGTNRITQSGVKALANSKCVSGLRHLDLSYNPLGPKGVQSLAEGDALRNLISFEYPMLDDERKDLRIEDSKIFFSKVDWPFLRYLNFSGVPVGANGVKALANSPQLARLRILKLSDTKLRDTGVTSLLTAPGVEGLLQLDLSENPIKKGAEVLLNPEALHNLRELDLTRCGISKPKADKFKQRSGKVVI